jgi:hypothetical protein
MRTVSCVAALCFVAALLFAGTAEAADSVYWTNGPANVIDRAPLSGGEGVSISPIPVGANRPEGSAVDAATGKLYWANYFGETIGESNLDGSGSASLETGAATRLGPIGVAIDPAIGKIFWAEQNGEKISWAYLDGSGGGDLDTSGAPVHGPYDVAVDPATGRVYWVNYQGESIGYANLDGSGGGGQLPIPGADIAGPTGLAIDAATDTIYWTNYVGGSIGWADLSGVGAGLLPISGGTGGPAGIAIDPEAGRIYWGGERIGGIWSAPLAGGTAQQLDTGAVDASRAGFPFLFKAPMPVSTAMPDVAQPARPGSTLTCGTVEWEPDLPESRLYRAPQSVAYEWTRDGVTIPDATSQSLVAAEPGGYACAVKATNGAGSTTVRVDSFSVTAPPEEHAAPHPGGPITVPAVPTVQLTKVKFDRMDGTAILFAKVSAPGKVMLSGRRIVHRQSRSAGVGIVKLEVTAKGKALRVLRQDGKAQARVLVKFVTSEGAVATASRSLVLRRKL